MVFAQPTIILRAFKSLKDSDERQFSVDILICSVQPTVSTTRKTHNFDRLSGTVCAIFWNWERHAKTTVAAFSYTLPHLSCSFSYSVALWMHVLSFTVLQYFQTCFICRCGGVWRLQSSFWFFRFYTNVLLAYKRKLDKYIHLWLSVENIIIHLPSICKY